MTPSLTRHLQLAATLLTLAAVTTGCVVTIPNGGTAGRGDTSALQLAPANQGGEEREALALINAYRSQQGLKTVRYDAKLQTAAEAHSRWMAETGTMSHTGAGGTDMVARMKAAGYCLRDANENVAYGQRTPQRVVTGWINSPGHNKNLLERGMTHGAVAGVRDARGTIWWTMVLGRSC